MGQSITPTEPRHTGLHDWDGAANRLGCTTRMVRKLVETRQIESVKVGRLVRIEDDAIDRFIERNRRPAV
jgi:excisionase family DNA binding protein